MDKVTGYILGVPKEISVTIIDSEGHVLRDDAAMAFAIMASAAEKDGIKLQVNSAFRDHAKQAHLYELYQTKLKAWEADGKKTAAPTPAARPGFSKHESGLAVDIEAPIKIYTWLKTYAERYGFHNTVWNEPWHWEFVAHG